MKIRFICKDNAEASDKMGENFFDFLLSQEEIYVDEVPELAPVLTTEFNNGDIEEALSDEDGEINLVISPLQVQGLLMALSVLLNESCEKTEDSVVSDKFSTPSEEISGLIDIIYENGKLGLDRTQVSPIAGLSLMLRPSFPYKNIEN